MSYGPELPPPGWYQDPENLQGPKRWWDGSDWTDRRRMDGPEPPPPGQLLGPGFGPSNQPAWYGRDYRQFAQFPSLDRAMSFGGRALGANWLPIAVVEFVTRVIPAVVTAQLIFEAVDGLTIDSELGVTGFDTSMLGLIGAVAAIAIVLALVGVSVTLSILLEFHDTNGESGPRSAVQLGPAVGRGLRRMLPLLGWYLLAVLAVGASSVVFTMFFVVIPPLGILLIFALIPLWIYVIVRFGFFGIAAVDGPGNPFSRSLKVSANRFWNVFGILALTFFAIFLLNVVLSFISNLIGAAGTPPVESVQGTDSVTFVTNFSVVALLTQGITTLVLGVFTSGFGGGVATLLYRAANPRPET